MTERYSLMLTPSLPLVSEKLHHYHYLTERHLQAIWLEQKFFKNLLTTTKEPIHIISPGIWNAEAGPDFLKAHLRIGNKEVRGDIEIHLHQASWFQHQHHLDERYDNVILHVCFWKSKNEKPILSKKGQQIFHTYLEEAITIPIERLSKMIDLDLYPYKNFLGSGKCAQELFKDLPENKTLSFFKEAASWRLTQKRQYIQYKNNDPSLWFSFGIAMSLGYKSNSEAFTTLFLKLLQMPFLNEEMRLAFCLGSCGFFEEPSLKKWAGSEKFQRLYHCYCQLNKKDFIPTKLSLYQKRPLNNPIRRLATLVKITCDKSLANLYSCMAELWKNSYSKKTSFALRKQLQEMIPSYQDPYWNFYYTFEASFQKKFLPLIGEDLKNTILINVFLPFLQEEVYQRNAFDEINAFEEFYRSFLPSKTGKIKYLIHRFFGESIKKHLINKAYLEQGLYQVHKDFCTHYEASCVGCPFVKNYLGIFGT